MECDKRHYESHKEYSENPREMNDTSGRQWGLSYADTCGDHHQDDDDYAVCKREQQRYSGRDGLRVQTTMPKEEAQG